MIAKSYLNFRERRLDEQENHTQKIKEKRYHGPKAKKGGSTNQEKKKNKPLMMLRPKKNLDNKQLTSLKQRIKSLKNKIGHVQSNTDYKNKVKKRIKNDSKTR